MAAATRLMNRTIILIAVGLIAEGCGRTPEIAPIPADEQSLRELAAAYRDFSSANKRAPKDLRELQEPAQRKTKGRAKRAGAQGQGMPNAVGMLKSGDLVVQWGAPLSPTGESAQAVLAYLKSVPEQGGPVLMQDGETIKTMTADEFKAAPKASGH